MGITRNTLNGGFEDDYESVAAQLRYQVDEIWFTQQREGKQSLLVDAPIVLGQEAIRLYSNPN